MTAEQLTAEQLTAEQLRKDELRTLDAEVEAVVFNSTWYRIRFDEKWQNGEAVECDRLRRPADVALYRAWGWPAQAISPEEGLANFLAENAGEIQRGRIWETPRYSTDIAAAWEMEEEIKRRGLYAEYGGAMSVLLDSPFVTASYYDFLHASPELRCRAALAAVREAAQ